MMNDSADLIRISFESQYKDIELSEFVSQSQPPPHASYSASSQQSIDSFPFNSLPDQILPDIPDIPIFCGALFTPEPSRNPSKEASSSVESNRGSAQPQPRQNIFNQFNHQAPRGRRYHNTNLLAQYCQEVLAITAHPTLSQIDGIVEKLKESDDTNHVAFKKLRSSVREWFRKRREYMATKVYKSCQRLLPPNAPEDKEEIDRFIKKIHKNSALIGIIMLESHLPMASEKEKIAFVKEKIVDFYMKYPARRKRNLASFKNNSFDDFAYEDEIVTLSQNDVNSLLSKK